MKLGLQRLFRIAGLPVELIRRLEINFAKLDETPEIYRVTSTYVFRVDDGVLSLQVDATAAAITVYLPTQPIGSRRYRISKTDASVNTVTISGSGYNISGAATFVLAAQYNSVEIEPTGTEYIAVNSI